MKVARNYWTPAQIDLLRKHYADTRTADLEPLLGHVTRTIYAKAYELGLNKSAAFLASPASCRTNGKQGIGSRFKPGNQSWNKGKHFVSGGRSVETQFQPKQQPHNTVPVGTTVTASDGYLKTKVAEPSQWKWTHRMNWEAAHGAIPKGMVLIFKDGNRNHCEVTNLELLTKRENMQRNSLHNYPKEVAHLIQLRGALNRQINKRSKKDEHTTTDQ